MKSTDKITQLFITKTIDTLPDMGAGHVYAGCASEKVSAQPVDGLTYRGWWVGVNGWDAVITNESGEVVARLAGVHHYGDANTTKYWRVLDNAPEWLRPLDTFTAAQAAEDEAAAERRQAELDLQADFDRLRKLKAQYVKEGGSTRFLKFLSRRAPELVPLARIA